MSLDTTVLVSDDTEYTLWGNAVVLRASLIAHKYLSLCIQLQEAYALSDTVRNSLFILSNYARQLIHNCTPEDGSAHESLQTSLTGFTKILQGSAFAQVDWHWAREFASWVTATTRIRMEMTLGLTETVSADPDHSVFFVEALAPWDDPDYPSMFEEGEIEAPRPPTASGNMTN